MENLPGMTRYRKEDAPPASLIPYGLQKESKRGLVSNPVKVPTERPIILLATALITEDNIFMNGLFQNIYILYRMFEAMHCTPIMCVNTKPTNLSKIPKYMYDLRIMCCEDFQRSPIPVKAYIEIGMSVDQGMHTFMKMCGAKICKLYLGNILNIDVETPIFMRGMHFAHHVKGDMDEIWVSPHYNQHAEYARALNFVDIEKSGPMVVPYVWNSQILTADGERRFAWKPATKPEDDVFLILEPNISFQKCSLVPLMMIEAWFRKHKDWKGKVVVVNGERFLMNPFFKESIQQNLDLHKEKKIELRGRMDILSILREFPSAIPICHQINNEYNYMVLEFFAAGYPVIHNGSDWASYGYSYEGSSISSGVRAIEVVRETHHSNKEIYKAHAEALQWKHSPYNPEIHRAWADALLR